MRILAGAFPEAALWVDGYTIFTLLKRIITSLGTLDSLAGPPEAPRTEGGPGSRFGDGWLSKE